MFKFGYITKKDIKKHNPNWPEIPDQPYRVLIIAGSGSGKKSLLNLIMNQILIKSIYMHYQLRINKRESTGLIIQKLL